MATQQTQVGKVYEEVITDLDITTIKTQVKKFYGEAIGDIGLVTQTKIGKAYIEVITDLVSSGGGGGTSIPQLCICT